MPLDSRQVQELRQAIETYAVPAVYYDFQAKRAVGAATMTEVEKVIARQLRSDSGGDVKDGLSNVLYWGFLKKCYRGVRVKRFRDQITARHIALFQAMVAGENVPNMVELRQVKIPEYSGMTFLSKALMFLNPKEYCVLDRLIIRLRSHNSDKALNSLRYTISDGQIRVTPVNQTVYDCWRAECKAISARYFDGEYRVADIERGFYRLLQQERMSSAQQIYDLA